jgi:hypothetical protein
MPYQPQPGQSTPAGDHDDVFTHALELVRKTLRADTEGCLDHSYRRWQSCGFHLTLARSHLDALRTTAKPSPGERDALADAAIHVLMALTLREAN